MKRLLHIAMFSVFLISSCGGVIPAVENSSTIKTVITHPELEVITPENSQSLEEIAKWGGSVVYDTAISPDRQTVAVRTSGGIHFYDSKTLDEIDFIEDEIRDTRDLKLAIAYSPDGKYLANSVNTVVSLINLSTRQIEKIISSPIPETNISSVEISQDNQHAIVITRTGSIYCDGLGSSITIYDISKKHGRMIFNN